MTNYYNSEFDIQGTTGSDESHLKKNNLHSGIKIDK